MEGDKGSTATRPTGRPRFGLWQFVSLAAAGGLIAGVGYFSLQVLKNHSFNDDRAFRVLTEIVGQFENLQGTMVSVRSLLPAVEIEAACAKAENEAKKTCKLRHERDFAQRLDIPGLKLVSANPPSCSRPGNMFEIQLTAVERPYSVFDCVDADSIVASNSPTRYQFQGDLKTSLPTFASQTFFDEAFIAAGTGAVIASIDRGLVANAAGRAQLQVEASGSSLITDVRQLLQRAAQEAARRPETAGDAKKEEPDKVPAGALPSQTVVLQHQIGGDTYRVFLLPFNPAYRTTLVIPKPATDGAQADQSATTTVPSGPMYVVGIKRDAVVEQVKHALWPNGTLGITVVVLVAILSWPLLGLRFASPHEPISRFSACASVIALLLLPMVLTTTAVWAWSRFALERWADAAVEQYARDIEGQLIAALKDNLTLLEDYDSKLYSIDGGRMRCEPEKPGLDGTSACRHPGPLQLLIRPPHGEHPAVMSSDLSAALAQDCCAELLLSPARPDAWQPEAESKPQSKTEAGWRQWSSLRTVIALDRNASKAGPRVTAFGDASRLQRRAFDIPNRPYFKALRQGEAWKPRPDSDTPWDYVPEHGFVAQRLFNRGDAARVLQVAIPRSCGESAPFCGVVTGDTRLHALTATVLPPLLRFAIVDRSTGTVLFHSDDNRSLAENLLTETENNADLLVALGNRVSANTWNRSLPSDHFRGSYLGDPHRFYYRPVLGMPWGIAVFYPQKELGDVSLRASIAAIGTALFGVLIVAAVFLLDSILNRGRLRSGLIRTLWPQWKQRHRYPVFHRVGAVIFVVAIAVYLLWVRSPSTARAWTAIGVAVAIGVAGAWLVLRRRRDVDTLHGYTSHYLKSMLVALCLMSVLPSLWLGLSFHDASVYSYLRSELAKAGESLERRHALIAHDLRRWSTPESARSQPDAWFLTRALPVPGYTVGASQRNSQRFVWTASLFNTMPWANQREPPRFGLVRCLIWQEAAQTSVQSRWSGRRPNERDSTERASAGTDSQAGGAIRPRDTSISACDWPTDQIRHYLSSDDGRRMTLGIAYRPMVAGGTVGRAGNPGTLDALRLLTLTIIVVTIFMLMWLLTKLIATRLLGVSIPFFARYLPADAESRWTAANDESLQHELAQLRRANPGEFSDKDEEDYIAVRTANTYNRIWDDLSTDERLLLHELAKGELANPADRSVIERLLRKGLLTLDPWPRIADRALERYAAANERASELAEWHHEAVRSTWSSVRTPLLLLLLVVVAALMWLAGSTMQLLSTVLAGTAALFGHFMQAANLLRGSQKS